MIKNIDQLKSEQEECLRYFIAGKDDVQLGTKFAANKNSFFHS